jgi:hypothetical protein
MIGHLLHVGYPKTGTKFLGRWFGAHPQLAYGTDSLAGFRDVHEIVRDGVAPRTGVLYRVTSCEGFTAPRRSPGGVIVSYDDAVDPAAAQENICSSLATLFPAAHVLIVTRGFRAMILSSFSQYVRSGGDATLEQLVAHPPAAGPWDYDRVTAMYRQAFGDDKVMVMPYELLRDDAERFLRTIEDCLGLTHFIIPSDRVNTSLSPVEMYWYPRVTRAVCSLPIGARLKRIYQHGAFVNRFSRVIALLQRVRPGKPVTADSIPDDVVTAYRGKARTLRDNPLYAPYARDYYHGDL